MRIAIAVWLVLIFCAAWSACFFDDPRFDQTRFRCDPGACPSDQKCVDHFCGDPQVGEVGVVCGDRFCQGAPCCDIGNSQPQCGTDASCVRLFACDGTEDCGTGERCCVRSANTVCQAAACDIQQVCSSDSQCPLGAPNCCPASYGDFKVCEFLPC